MDPPADLLIIIQLLLKSHVNSCLYYTLNFSMKKFPNCGPNKLDVRVKKSYVVQ